MSKTIIHESSSTFNTQISTNQSMESKFNKNDEKTKFTPIKIIFMGSGNFAFPTLYTLSNHKEIHIAAVYTTQGAGKTKNDSAPLAKFHKSSHITIINKKENNSESNNACPYSPQYPTEKDYDTYSTFYGDICNFSLHKSIKTATPARLVGEVLNEIEELKPDLIAVVSYGIILPKKVLQIPKYGCINLHPSSLPRWRGAAPIQRAIIDGDRELDICVMMMDEGCDTGAVIDRKKFSLKSEEQTHGEVSAEVAIIGARMMLETVLYTAEKGCVPPAIPQHNHGATYAHKISKNDEIIEWEKGIEHAHRLICALSPNPGAYCFFRGKRLKLLRSKMISSLQREINTEKSISLSFLDKLYTINVEEFSENKNHQINNNITNHFLKYVAIVSLMGRIFIIDPADAKTAAYLICASEDGNALKDEKYCHNLIDITCLEIKEMQIEGGKILNAAQFINGYMKKK